MNAIGHIYEEPDGVMNFTAKLAEFLPAYTRRISNPKEFWKEVLGLPSDVMNQVMELCANRTLSALRGDQKAWARILLYTPDEPFFSVRFAVFYETDGPVLAYCLDRPFMSAGFSSNAGARFETVEQLVQALDCVGLPGKEICSSTHRVYAVTRPQLRMLYLGTPSALIG